MISARLYLKIFNTIAVHDRLAEIRFHMVTEVLATDWKRRVQVVQGDITRQNVVIVNAANESLLRLEYAIAY